MGSDTSEGLARTVFVGEFARSVDGNGRLALPATFRDDLGSRCYVTAHPDGYVAIATERSFKRKAKKVLADIESGSRPVSAQRDLGRATSMVSVDKQARITLDEQLRTHAGIAANGQAVVVGALDELQIWRPSRYSTVSDEHVVIEPGRRWNDEGDE